MASRLPENRCFQVRPGRARAGGSMEVVKVWLEREGRRGPGFGSSLVWLLAAALILVVPAARPADAQKEPRVVVTVTPEKTTLSPGDTLQYKAVADFGAGAPQDVTDQVEWRTTESDIARFSKNKGEEGLLTARAPGQVTVRATLEGAERDSTGTAALTVNTGTIVSLTTRPGTKRLEVGRPV